MNKGLPHYVAMDRKPENGCEIQNAACIDSNIMIQLKLVKSKEDEERLESRRSDKEERTELNHGTKVVLDLTKPWNHTGREIIGDSAFASVATAVECMKKGNNFTGCVKTATKEFPMQELDDHVFVRRGERKALVGMGLVRPQSPLFHYFRTRTRRGRSNLSREMEAIRPRSSSSTGFVIRAKKEVVRSG